MDLASLTLLVAAIRAHARDHRLIVFGSGSLLASFPDLGECDSMVRHSRDADFLLFPWNEELALEIHRTVGADYSFDREHGFYADIVRPFATENFPPDFESRLVPLDGCPNVFCLDPHDMAVAKLMVGRPKDIALLADLARQQRLDLDRVAALLRRTPLTEAMIVKTRRVLDEVRAATES
jgi:hypothetical protein